MNTWGAAPSACIMKPPKSAPHRCGREQGDPPSPVPLPWGTLQTSAGAAAWDWHPHPTLGTEPGPEGSPHTLPQHWGSHQPPQGRSTHWQVTGYCIH